MSNQDIIESLKRANEELSRAGTELYRPMEQVVSISVCHHTQDTMKRMMTLYLRKHEVSVQENASLEQLFDDCYRVNKDFIKVNLNDIDCKNLDADSCKDQYCLSVDNVTCCSNVAKQLKDVIWQDMGIDG